MEQRTFFGVLAAASPDVADALRRALRAARAGWAELPRVGGLDPYLVARGVYRDGVAEEGWAPLLQVDPGQIAGVVDLERGLEVARGGWVYVGPGWEGRLDPEGLVARVRGVRARLLLQGSVALLGVPAEVSRALAALDAHHAVATDPSLARVRAALLAHCARAETVFLSGPVGSGRRALARWAHATIDDRPLTVLAPGSPPEPGAWWLVPDLGELDDAVLGALRGRLEAAEPPLTPALFDGVGERPRDRAFSGMVGRSEALCAVLRDAERVAPASATVLLLGESGVGKEPLAAAIHAASGRSGPYVAVDLASRSSNLVEDDLFGHVPYAFDGARSAREGAFKRAHKGTLFLDEIGNLPLALQAKLLRVLERGEVQPLGSDEVARVDVRVIAATNVDLDAMVRLGEFRRDLYHRLAGKVLRLPPLRARASDLPVLMAHFLRAEGHPGEVTPEALAVLRAHAWPGNVRELRKVAAAASIDSEGAPVRPEHLGELAPERARRAPLLVTGDAAALEGVALPRRQVRQLAALTLSLEGPAARGPGCVRNAALALLAGRVVTPEALRMLEAHPWWGGFVEMERKLGALVATPPGVIDAERLAATLPELAQESGWEPILTVQHPSVDGDTVGGLQAALATAAVAIGRARRTADVEGTRAAWLRRLVGDGSVGFVAFPHVRTLSRVHAVVTRVGEGLAVHRAPATRLEVRAGAVGSALERVEEGAFVAVGEAGRVVVVGDDGPVVDLHVFRGPIALRAAAALLDANAGDAGATQHGGSAQRARGLGEAEEAWLLAFLEAFVEGEEVFSAALRRAAPTAPGDWLGEYLDSTNPPQSLKRVLEQKANAALCQRFRDRLAEAGRTARARGRLPILVGSVLFGGPG